MFLKILWRKKETSSKKFECASAMIFIYCKDLYLYWSYLHSKIYHTYSEIFKNLYIILLPNYVMIKYLCM